MIQRIQSLWFLSASATAVLMFFFPVIEPSSESTFYVYNYESISIGGLDNFIQTGYIIAALLGIIALLSFLAIFLFKKRILQIRICTFIVLLILFVSALITIFSLSGKGNAPAAIGLSAVLPVIMLIFILMARRAVKRDEALVKSADRIR